MELVRKDWEDMKTTAEAQLKRALVDAEVFSLVLEKATKELKKFPKEDEKKPIGV